MERGQRRWRRGRSAPEEGGEPPSADSEHPGGPGEALLTDPNQARLSGLTEELVARVFRLRQMEAMLAELDATVLRLREAAANRPVAGDADHAAPVVAAEAQRQGST